MLRQGSHLERHFVAQIFISHSSNNNAEAKALGEWLLQHGWEDVFLDFHPERGIGGGDVGSEPSTKRHCAARQLCSWFRAHGSTPPGAGES
jgi:hypothetical protein